MVAAQVSTDDSVAAQAVAQGIEVEVALALLRPRHHRLAGRRRPRAPATRGQPAGRARRHAARLQRRPVELRRHRPGHEALASTMLAPLVIPPPPSPSRWARSASAW